MEEDEDKQEDEDKVIEAELKISMHCNACERSVASTIAKFKGIEKFTTDMRRHTVMITGKNIDLMKMMKKLKKKTGKRVEIVPPPEQETEKVVDEQMKFNARDGEALMNELVLFGGSHWRGCDFTTMFSDENTNACLIM